VDGVLYPSAAAALAGPWELMGAHLRKQRSRKVVAATVLAVVMATVLGMLTLRFASRNPDKANLGSSVFKFEARRLAREVDRDGPFLLKDPLNREREVYVQHLGDNPETGWITIRAYGSRVALECLLRWDNRRREFIDPCGNRTYPADGEGLVTYPTRVEAGRVNVDLRSGR
jgi:hypothetical protein